MSDEEIPSLRELFGLDKQTLSEVVSDGRNELNEMLEDPVFKKLPEHLQESLRSVIAGLDDIDEAIAMGMLVDSQVLRSLLIDLSSDEECDFDHHGNCQMHNWFGEDECPHARAKRLLAGVVVDDE